MGFFLLLGASAREQRQITSFEFAAICVCFFEGSVSDESYAREMKDRFFCVCFFPFLFVCFFVFLRLDFPRARITEISTGKELVFISVDGIHTTDCWNHCVQQESPQ